MIDSSPPAGHALDAPHREPPVRRGPRLRYIVAAVLCVSAVVYLVFFGLGSNIVYFRTPTEAVASRAKDGTHRFRLAGVYVPDSKVDTPDGIKFVIADDRARIAVVHTGETPALFKPGVPVVCEGRWAKDAFDCDRILIKHDNNYTPKQEVKTITTVTVESHK